MEILLTFGSALWFGILTSISPCPLLVRVCLKTRKMFVE